MSDPSSMDARQQRYDELLQQIGGALLGAAPPGWRRLDLIAKIADGVQDVGLTVIMSDFTDAWVGPPEHLTAAFAELRDVMADEQRGLWRSARYTMDPPNAFQVFFNYDHDPLWDPPLPAGAPPPEPFVAGTGPLGIQERGDLRRRIADLLVARAPAGRDQIRVMYNAVGGHEEVIGHVLGIDGQLREWAPPSELAAYYRRLRAGAYTGGVGTWTSAATVVEYPIRISIEYRNEARWHAAPSRWDVLDELERYPRSAEHVPDWMTTALPNARQAAEVAGRFRRARIFDRRDESGRPVVERPAVPDAERHRLLDYLNAAPVIVSGRGFEPDLFDPEGAQDTPSAHHTDGVWMWTASVPHYLAKHGVAPEPDLVEHVRRNGFTLPEVGQEARDAAYLALTGELPAPAPPSLPDRDRRILAIIERQLSEAGVLPAVYRLLDSAEGATCLERVGDEWQVADYERGKPRGPQRFAQLWDAGAFLLGSLTIIPSRLRGGVKDRNTAAALNDWPVQPLPGEPPLTLLTEKRIAVLMPGRELVRYGEPGGNLTFAAGTEFAAMSLRPEREQQGPRRYRVERELRVLAGQTVPWHDQPGGGPAYLLPKAVDDHVADGSLTAEP